MMRKLISSCFSKCVLKIKRKTNNKIFDNYFDKIIKSNNIRLRSTAMLQQWTSKWSIFGSKPTPKEFAAYSYYMGENINIVPNDIARNHIEPILTPEDLQPFYNDKNSFNMFLPDHLMPKVYFRSMNGLLYDGSYRPFQKDKFDLLFEDAERLVVKPSKELGGKGVAVFDKKGDCYVDTNGNVLSLSYLLNTYERNFIVQEYLKQSDYMAQFNPTSLNTIRIATYRDISTGEIIILGAFIRIGGKGAIVDNISSGGSSVEIDMDGNLGKYAYDKYRCKCDIYNGINFRENGFKIPNFDKVKDLVKEVARCMPHMSLFANDVAIDENGEPKLIEVNTMQFAYTFYQVCGHPVFGEYTDKLIEYCLNEQKRIKPTWVQKYE